MSILAAHRQSGIMVLLSASTVGYLPTSSAAFSQGVTVSSEKIAGWLILLTLLPLAIGLALRERYKEVAARVKPVLDWVSNVSLLPTVLLLAAPNIDTILHVFVTCGMPPNFY